MHEDSPVIFLYYDNDYSAVNVRAGEELVEQFAMRGGSGRYMSRRVTSQ